MADWDGTLPVEDGGTITFVCADGTDWQVPSTVSYAVSNDLSSQINQLGTSKQNTLTTSDKNGIVKNALATDTGLSGLTDAEKANACAVIGAEREKGEWVLKGTIAGDENDRGNIDSTLSVDLTGCKEIFVTGHTKATGRTAFDLNDEYAVYDFTTNNNRWFDLYFINRPLTGIMPLSCKQYTQDGFLASVFSSPASIFGRSLTKISDINKIRLEQPSVVTVCDIKIYAR